MRTSARASYSLTEDDHPRRCSASTPRRQRIAARRDHPVEPRADARDVPRHLPRRGVHADRCTPTRPGATWRRRTSQNSVQLQGNWRVENQKIVAGPGARLHFRYIAPRIYLVAAPPTGSPRTLSAMVDGGASRRIHVGHDDLYELAHLTSPGPHLLDAVRAERHRASTRSRSARTDRAASSTRCRPARRG